MSKLTKEEKLELLKRANLVWVTQHRLTLEIVRELYKNFPATSVDGALGNFNGYQDWRVQDTGLKRYTDPRTHLSEFPGFKVLWKSVGGR